MKTTKTPADTILKMLAPQYKPLEAVLKQEFPEQYKLYKKMPAIQKIKALDLLAQHLGL